MEVSERERREEGLVWSTDTDCCSRSQMLQLMELDSSDPAGIKAYRLQVKARLYRFNKVRTTAGFQDDPHADPSPRCTRYRTSSSTSTSPNVTQSCRRRTRISSRQSMAIWWEWTLSLSFFRQERARLVVRLGVAVMV